MLFPRSAAVCSILFFALPAAGADELTVDDVVAAWRTNQAKITSARFTWTSKLWIKAGSLSGFGFDSEDDEPRPATDVTQTFHRTLFFRDNLVHYESDGPQWDPTKKDYISRKLVYTWDGDASTDFNGDDDVPYAFVKPMNNKIWQPELTPFRFAFGMIHKDWFDFDKKEYEISDRSQEIDGLQCLVMETAKKLVAEKAKRGSRALKAVFWVCPDQGFSIPRYAGVDESTGLPTGEFDIKYQHDEASDLWLPASWVTTMYPGFRGKEPNEIETASVESFELGVEAPDELFVADLPANTIVTNVGEQTDYIARKDGTKRTITRAEMVRGATYKELVNTESGQAGLAPSRRTWSPWWFLALAAIVAAPVLYWFFRLR